MSRLNTVVMVPKGAEFKAVQKGLRWASSETQERTPLKLISLPVGPGPVKAFLSQWCQASGDITSSTTVVLMGLCGSLTPRLRVNDVVIYERCLDGVLNQPERQLPSHHDFSVGSLKTFVPSVTPVTGLMCDRVVSRATEKHQLGQRFQADVVDMEGYAALEILFKSVQQVAMLRVVSDDATHDVPDLNGAFDLSGNLKPWVMARQFLLQPLGALRLIRGSLSALSHLEKLAYGVAIQSQRQ